MVCGSILFKSRHSKVEIIILEVEENEESISSLQPYVGGLTPVAGTMFWKRPLSLMTLLEASGAKAERMENEGGVLSSFAP